MSIVGVRLELHRAGEDECQSRERKTDRYQTDKCIRNKSQEKSKGEIFDLTSTCKARFCRDTTKDSDSVSTSRGR